VIAGDKKDAMGLFKKCTSTGEQGHPEYISAGAELTASKQ